MLARPGMVLRVSPADRFEAAGPLAARVRGVVERFAGCRKLAALPACRIEIVYAPPEHVGLGTGTQLALSVVAGLTAFLGEAPPESAELAAAGWAGLPARRSAPTVSHAAVSSSTPAKTPGEPLAPLAQRVELPPAWRFVLVIPGHERGLSGDEERLAFEALPPVSASTTAQLREELAERLFPAAERGDFEQFGESLYRYGHAAGLCFAARQSGAFASPRVAELVATIRSLGVRGTGQSSWGPTVFALLESAQSADAFRQRLSPVLAEGDEVVVTEPNNTGAESCECQHHEAVRRHALVSPPG